MNPHPNPDILLAARESRAKSQTEVADAAEVSQGLISKAENGILDLTDRHVERIAEFLHYPPGMFYEPGRIRLVGSGCLYHRKRKTLPVGILKSLNARMELRCIGVRRLLRDIDIDAERMFHTMDPDEYDQSPERVAQALRTAWRVPPGPIANMTALIESAGGVVLTADFGTNKLMGMSCWERGFPPVFYLNSRSAPEHLRWTMAHELGHLVMHAVPPDGDPEEQADNFAGEFLAPRALVVPDLRRLTFDRLFALKIAWKISMKALISRADRLGAIEQEAARRLFKRYSARGFNAREPYPLPPEPQTIIPAAVRVHLTEHGYSPEELAAGVAYLFPDDFSEEFVPLPCRPRGNVVSLFAKDRHRA